MFNFNTPKTVDGVMAAFNLAISQLKGVVQQQDDIAAEQAFIANEALEAQRVALEEAGRANAIVVKMQAVFEA